MDEAQPSPARAKERESHPAAAEGGSEGLPQTAQTEAEAREPLVRVAADSDESAVASGTLEAAALGAAARGIDAEAATRETESVAAPSGQSERELELDFDAAERYAASIRPSWADPAPPAPSIQPSQAIGGTDGIARVVRHNTRIDLNPPLRKRRGTAYAILGASLLGVAGLLYFGVASSTVDHSVERGLNAKDAPPAAVKALPETTVQAAQSPTVLQPELERRGPRLSDPEPSEPAAAIAPSEAADPAAADAPEGAQLAAAIDPAAQNAAQAEPEQAAAAGDPQVAAQPLAAAAQPPAADAPQAQATGATQGAAPAAPAPSADFQAAPAAQQGLAAAAPQAQPPAAAAGPAPRAAPPAEKLAANPVPELKSLQPSAALAPRPEAAASGDKVLLSLAAYPPSTRLRVDGLLVANPYKARLPKSSKHRIDAVAPGFAPETHVMRMEADVQLMISLKREPPRDVKADPYRDAARRNPTAAGPKRDRGAGFVAENPY